MKLVTENPVLTEIIANPSLVETLGPEEVAALLGQLETVRAQLWSRLVLAGGTNHTGSVQDRRLGVEETAKKLACSKDYLYRHANSLPFVVRIGRGLGFSEAGIERFLRQRAGR